MKLKKTLKVGSKPKQEVKKVAAKKVHMLVPPLKTVKSKAFLKLKWVAKESRLPGTCLKKGCSKTGVQGQWCKKHRKIIRKVQLKLNNIPWRKKVKAQGKSYKPNQMHVVYGGKATPATLKDQKRASKRVRLGKSTVIETQKMLDKAISLAKQEHKENKPKKPVNVTTNGKPKKIPVLDRTPKAKVIPVKHAIKSHSVVTKHTAKAKKAPAVMDFT